MQEFVLFVFFLLDQMRRNMDCSCRLKLWSVFVPYHLLQTWALIDLKVETIGLKLIMQYGQAGKIWPRHIFTSLKTEYVQVGAI